MGISKEHWDKIQRSKRRRHNKRKIARQKLGLILLRQNNKCHWCGVEIFRLKEVARKHRIVSEENYFFTYEDETGRHVSVMWATADHVVPLANGGSNTVDNIVAACKQCNEERSHAS